MIHAHAVTALALGGMLTSTLVPATGTVRNDDRRSLQVVSYNIHHGTGNDECTPERTEGPPGRDCGYDLARSARTIASLGADIVALQEVDRFWNRSAGDDQPRRLGDALGMQTCFGANLIHAPDVHSPVAHEYGTLTLSRVPIVGCRNSRLPHPGGEQRGVLETVVDIDGSRVRVFNTHLDTRVESRAAQVPALVSLVATGGDPVVILGDFNAEPDAAEMAPVFERFTDAWRVAGDGPGFTSPATLATDPARRIDYIFTSPPPVVQVQDARVVVTNDTRITSDHYPVQASVSFRR